VGATVESAAEEADRAVAAAQEIASEAKRAALHMASEAQGGAKRALGMEGSGGGSSSSSKGGGGNGAAEGGDSGSAAGARCPGQYQGTQPVRLPSKAFSEAGTCRCTVATQ